MYESLLPKVAIKVDETDTNFGNIDNLLVELKGLVLKSSFFSSSIITAELISKKFKLLESIIQHELAPVAKLIQMMPTDAPLVSIGVQGEKRELLALFGELVEAHRIKKMMMRRFLGRSCLLKF
ncbi:unnamed protein product [Lactuca saligna]|uniref:Uncharacterized protein n=1 Tax=Lactuca saligna TaxID=75948 RepID=A0AA36EMS9_LACSI|nr:unnamed protein product [Lactuca saligna]